MKIKSKQPGGGFTARRPWSLPLGVSRRMVLRAGYGAVIALLVFSAWQAYRIQSTASAENIEIYRQYVKQDELLGSLRRTIWLGAGYVRDFFLSVQPERGPRLRSELEDLRAKSNRALDELDRLPNNEQGHPVLREKIEEYWDTIAPVADTMVNADDRTASAFIRHEIVPRRSALNTALRELGGAGQENLQSSEEQFAINRKTAIRRLLILLGMCVVLGLLVARFSVNYAEHLELETERQYEEVAHTKRELQWLSARLLEIQEEESRRLSRELHDEIGQTLTALRIEISHASASAENPSTRERLGRARDLAEKTVRTVRNISLLLRPALLDDLGLVPALQWQLEDFTHRSGIGCEFSEQNVREQLPDAVKTCVFRIVQEALHNSEKHAAATLIQLSLRQNPDTLTVEVSDNGCGFDLNTKGMPRTSAGLGIIGMRERAVILGGSLTLESSPGHGTRLTLRIPVPTGPPKTLPRNTEVNT